MSELLGEVIDNGEAGDFGLDLPSAFLTLSASDVYQFADKESELPGPEVHFANLPIGTSGGPVVVHFLRSPASFPAHCDLHRCATRP